MQRWVLMQSIFLIIILQLNLPLSTVDFSFAQLSYRFLYRQNKLESIRAVNIPNVTTCVMIPFFQPLMKIMCPNGTLNCIHIRMFDLFFHIWLHFYHHVLVTELQFFKHVKYAFSINQMRLFWLLNKMYFRKMMEKHFTFCTQNNQNKCIWSIECTHFTHLKNCSSMINTW